MIILFRRPWSLLVAASLLIAVGVLAGRFVSPALQAVTSMVSGRLVPIYKVETPEQRIAISFDATWGTELTDEILAILDRYGVKTTFFLAGYWVEKHPDYVKKIHEAGHEIGTHSYAHPHMNSMTRDEIIADL